MSLKFPRLRPGSAARFGGIAAVAAALLYLGACNVVPPPQDDSTQYYVLSDLPPPSESARPPAAPGVRIGLRIVHLNGYLKDRPMVVRTGENELRFEDFHRWAEPLDTAIGRILRERLLQAPGVSQIFTEPFPFDQQRDFDVSVEVTRFEGAVAASGGYSSDLRAVVEISTTGPGRRVISRKVFVAPAKAWNGTDYGRLAALLSEDVAELGGEVVSEIPAKDD